MNPITTPSKSPSARPLALTAGTLALPPGPFGWLTIAPELYAVWKIQAQLVSDIAGAYGKRNLLTREQMLYCLFGHTAAGAFRDLVIRVGERYVIRRAPLSALYAIANKIGIRIAQRTAGRVVTRWVPALGALGVAGYVFVDTGRVADACIDLFSRDVKIEGELEVEGVVEMARALPDTSPRTATRKPAGDKFAGAAAGRKSAGGKVASEASGRKSAGAKPARGKAAAAASGSDKPAKGAPRRRVDAGAMQVEIGGHALGIAHNFAASTQGRYSVMEPLLVGAALASGELGQAERQALVKRSTRSSGSSSSLLEVRSWVVVSVLPLAGSGTAGKTTASNRPSASYSSIQRPGSL